MLLDNTLSQEYRGMCHSLNTILIRRILLSEPCTIIFRMCSSGLSYNVSQCVLNVLICYNFFHCSACAFDMCLLNYLLTYLLIQKSIVVMIA